MSKKAITYADLKSKLDALTPEQLEQPVVWSGDERGGHVKYVWTAEEDWIGEPSDWETCLPRSEAMKMDAESYSEASVMIPQGAVHLMVD
jgi:hypothetical protein